MLIYDISATLSGHLGILRAFGKLNCISPYFQDKIGHLGSRSLVSMGQQRLINMLMDPAVKYYTGRKKTAVFLWWLFST